MPDTPNSQPTIYDLQMTRMEELKKSNAPSEANEEEYYKTYIASLLDRLKSEKNVIIIGFLYIIYVLMIIRNINAFINSVIYLSAEPYNLNIVFTGISLVAPLITWVLSTKYKFYNYKVQKFTGLYIALINISVFLAIFCETLVFNLLLPLIFKIPVGLNVTPKMVVSLARLASIILSVFPTILFAKAIFSSISNKMTQADIMHFKINRNADERKHKEFAYDLKIVRRMLDGKVHNIKEKDRSLHSMLVGTTGTGKTSSCITVAVNDDLDQRIRNEDWQKKQLFSLLSNGKIRLLRDFEDCDFSANYFVPADENDEDIIKKLHKIQTLAASAGVTVMAPNAAFADEIFRLVKAKGLKCNRLDPELEKNQHKEGFIGLNPYYISPRLTGIEREIEIFTRSTLVADVLQAIFDQSGSTDIYFATLNQNVSTTVSSVVLLTYPSLHKKQPTLKIFQSIVNDFSKIKPYRDELVRLYSKKFNPDRSPVMEPGRAFIGDNYQFLLDTVDNELLGSGAAKMIDQARGLRNIINQILVNPLVKDILCSENSIDMDAMLADGQITIVNYALKLGSAGVAFGLFFMLSFIKAVLRRPGNEKTRLPHFFYVDEFPTLLHPQEEAIFTYFRQFRVSAMVALQTLDQMDKSKSTAFLKGVLIGNCAHQILFGRASTSEMELYQKLAGTVNEMQEMTGYVETALSSDAPAYSTNYRETLKESNVFSTSELRMRDFQEVTVFTVDKSAPFPPFHGKVDFLPEYKLKRPRRKRYDWHQYYEPYETDAEDNPSDDLLSNSVPVAQTSVNAVSENQTISAITKAETHTDNIDATADSITISATNESVPKKGMAEEPAASEEDEVGIINY